MINNKNSVPGNSDPVSPEDNSIKGREDSLDNIEQGILSRANELDQLAPGSAAEINAQSDLSISDQKPHHLSVKDEQEIRKQVDEDAIKQTGHPTGAIYGSNGDIITVNDSFTS